jgi:hypothetical protein
MKAEPGGTGEGCCRGSSGYRGGTAGSARPASAAGSGSEPGPRALGCGSAARPRLRGRVGVRASWPWLRGPPAWPWLRGQVGAQPRGLGCGVCRGLGGPGLRFRRLAEAPVGCWLGSRLKIIHTQLNQKPISQELIVN